MVRRNFRVVVTVAILAVLAVTIYLIWTRCRTNQVLPAVAEISEMKASYHEGEEFKEVEFDVPKEHWQKILDALLPAEFDPWPPGWEVLGELHIKLKNGCPFFVMFASKHGAFASGETIERRRYYRGGDSTRLREALRAAYEASQKKTEGI